MTRYPIGIQDFKSLRQDGYLYVDKTPFIPRLLRGQFYFLSRPRRFGKSLFLSTLEYFFKGERELFKGLAIDSYPDWEWASHPVVRLDLNAGNYVLEGGLERKLDSLFKEIESQYGIECPYADPPLRFLHIIKTLCSKEGSKVVVLIDEYDKPLLDVIDKPGLNETNKEMLRSVYSVLKSADQYIKMAFLTGVTRFGHLNIFSGLNNFQDISLNDEYAALCGVTEKELIENFREGIANLADKRGISFEEAVIRLKEYYDGYHFSEQLVDVYNPYSLITALSEGKIKDIWAYTGNSDYLLRQLQKQDFDLFELEGIVASTKMLTGVDPDYTDPVTLLYQSGYLTIKGIGKREGTYLLGLPNHEVSSALYEAIVPFVTKRSEAFLEKAYGKIQEWLSSGDVESFLLWLKEFFARLTYDVKILPLTDRMRRESDFQFVVFCILSLACGLDKVNIEQTTSNGRIDISVETEKYVYIFEFKLSDDASEAINQIRSKDYAARWASDSRGIKLIGVAFSPDTRDIADYRII